MSFLAKVKASLGNAVLKGQLTPTTAQHFDYQQNELWTGSVTAVASQITTIALRVYSPSLKAQQDYGYPAQPGDFRIYNIPWNQTQTITAQDLATMINAAEDFVTVTSTGSGGFTVEAKKGSDNFPGLVIEFAHLIRCTITRTVQGFDLLTYDGDAILVGSTTGGAINITETGVAPTAGVGIAIAKDDPFDVVGALNIINAQVIESDGAQPATVNYQIYIG